MQSKYYCPIGKIQCKRFLGFTTASERIMCGNNEYADYIAMGQTYELCPIPSKQVKIERYPMGDDQPAQIDCRRDGCIWCHGAGKCTNISPAITLYGSTFVCWSFGIKNEPAT